MTGDTTESGTLYANYGISYTFAPTITKAYNVWGNVPSNVGTKGSTLNIIQPIICQENVVNINNGGQNSCYDRTDAMTLGYAITSNYKYHIAYDTIANIYGFKFWRSFDNKILHPRYIGFYSVNASFEAFIYGKLSAYNSSTFVRNTYISDSFYGYGTFTFRPPTTNQPPIYEANGKTVCGTNVGINTFSFTDVFDETKLRYYSPIVTNTASGNTIQVMINQYIKVFQNSSILTSGWGSANIYKGVEKFPTDYVDSTSTDTRFLILNTATINLTSTAKSGEFAGSSSYGAWTVVAVPINYNKTGICTDNTYLPSSTTTTYDYTGAFSPSSSIAPTYCGFSFASTKNVKFWSARTYTAHTPCFYY